MSEHNPEKSSRRRGKDRSPLRPYIKTLELIGGTLLCSLVAMTPWLYGTTERWAINLMNYGSFAAGIVFLAAAILQRVSKPEASASDGDGKRRWPKIAFLTVNLLLLAFCLIAWWNARATFFIHDNSFIYREYIRWLPTTYDADITLATLLNLLACFVAFWSARYWLMRGWERAVASRAEGTVATAISNRRFNTLLWVISLNGMLLAIQGILQRLSGSSKLLWLRTSYWNDSASCFGPFSYRGNAAEYLNLIWPAALAFWWALSRERRRTQGSARTMTDGPELMLIPAVVIMAAASFVALSRGGALVAAGLLVAIFILFAVQKKTSALRRTVGAAVLAAVLGLVTFLGWTHLIARFNEDTVGDLSGRTEIYRNARQMTADYPLFGVGPGAFQSVYHMYRADATQSRHGFLHDDWLETLVTIGWVGSSLVLLQLVLLVFWVLAAGKPPAPGMFVFCVGLALMGCLAHAKVDFPLQTYSIFYTFVILGAILSTVTPERR